MAHASALIVAGLVIIAARRPALWALLAAPVGPAAVALLGRGGAFARRHAAEALRFHLSVALYGAAVGVGLVATARYPVVIWLFPALLLLVFLLVVNWIVFAVLAAARAARGGDFAYPFTIRLRR